MRSNLATAAGAADFESRTVRAGAALDYARLVGEGGIAVDAQGQAVLQHWAVAAPKTGSRDAVEVVSKLAGYGGLLAGFGVTGILLTWLVA